MAPKSAEPDPFAELSHMETLVTGNTGKEPRPVLQIAIGLSAIFHISLLYAFASELLGNNKTDTLDVNQPIEIQVEIIQATNSVLDNPPPETNSEPQTAEQPADLVQEQIAEIQVFEEQNIAETSAEIAVGGGEPLDLSAESINAAVARIVETSADSNNQVSIPVEGPYANGFDPRFQQKLADDRYRAPAPETPEENQWTSLYGTSTSVVGENRCIDSMPYYAEEIGSPTPQAQWTGTYKCGEDAGDRMMQRVNARLFGSP